MSARERVPWLMPSAAMKTRFLAFFVGSEGGGLVLECVGGSCVGDGKCKCKGKRKGNCKC